MRKSEISVLTESLDTYRQPLLGGGGGGGVDVTSVAAKTAGLTADVRGHSCNATHERWLEFHMQTSDN